MSGSENNAAVKAVVSENVDDLCVPGVIVAVDAGTAEEMGAFREEALSEADAWEANADLSGVA